MTWDAKSVEREITRAFITRRLTTRNPGPKEYGNGWPDVLYDLEDKRDHEERPIRVNVTSKDISAADAIFFEVLNKIDCLDIRKTIYRYHYWRSKGLSLDAVAEKLEQSRRKMSRDLSLYHQALVKDFLRSDCLRKRGKVDDVPENQPNDRVKGELRQRENLGKIQGWMEPDARPKAVDFGSTQEMRDEVAG